MNTTNPTQLPKDDSVNIKQAYPVLVPNSMGGVAQAVWGLGDDNKMYLWDSKKGMWIAG